MDGHERHLVVVARVLLLVHVGGERHALQPLLDGGLPELFARTNLGVALLLEKLHQVEQLLDVVERRSSLGAVLSAEERQNARTRRHLHTEVVESLLRTFERERADERHELGDLAHDRALHGIAHRLGHQRVDRLPHRHAPLGRQLGDTQHGGVADAARRIVDDAPEGLVVARVDHQPDIGQHILDLLAVVERRPLVDAVGNAAAAQRLFERLRLVVGAVEDRRFVPRIARGAHLVAQILYDQLGLLAVGVGFQHTDLLALVALREAPLFHAARIVDDHRVGRLDDRARRTVVLFQLEDFRFGIVALEGEDVFDLGAAERVDRLCVVAHDADLAVMLRQAADDDVLRVVGILIFVDQNIFELLLITLQHVGTVAQQDVGL